jgi:biotin carboxyl carrier protein
MIYDVIIEGQHYRLDLNLVEARWECRIDGRAVEVDAVLVRPNVLSIRIANQVYEVKCEPVGNETRVWVGRQGLAAEVRDPRSLRSRVRPLEEEGPRKLTAPMPGKVVRVLMSEGASIDAGAGVVVVEAMKMQNEVKSPKKGTIQKILVAEGAAVNAGDVLAIVD